MNLDEVSQRDLDESPARDYIIASVRGVMPGIPQPLDEYCRRGGGQTLWGSFARSRQWIKDHMGEEVIVHRADCSDKHDEKLLLSFSFDKEWVESIFLTEGREMISRKVPVDAILAVIAGGKYCEVIIPRALV